MERRKVKKILYDKYVPILTIRDDYVDNHFSDKFVSICHVDYFINGDGRKLTVGYLWHFLPFQGLNFVFFIFQGHIYQRITHSTTKVVIYPLLYKKDQSVK